MNVYRASISYSGEVISDWSQVPSGECDWMPGERGVAVCLPQRCCAQASFPPLTLVHSQVSCSSPLKSQSHPTPLPSYWMSSPGEDACKVPRPLLHRCQWQQKTRNVWASTATRLDWSLMSRSVQTILFSFIFPLTSCLFWKCLLSAKILFKCTSSSLNPEEEVWKLSASVCGVVSPSSAIPLFTMLTWFLL